MTDTPRAHLILGASGGIGSATARRLRAAGHNVFLAGRNVERLQSLAAKLESPWRAVDARVVDDVAALARHVCETWGRLDGLACCVGSLLLKPAHLTTPAEWAEVLATNLTAAFAAARAAGETMREHGGSVALIASAAGRIGLPNHEAIAAAKAGVIGLTQAAAASYASRRLRFNAVAPGLVRTDLTARVWREPKSAEASRQMHPLGRLGEADDVAAAIQWLLGPESDWVTGQVLGVDGGLSTLKTIRG